MPRAEVPMRILNVRRLARHDLWDVVRFKVVDGRRMLRKWLADTTVIDELRAGDAELLARFEAHLAERKPARLRFLTSEEALAMLMADRTAYAVCRGLRPVRLSLAGSPRSAW